MMIEPKLCQDQKAQKIQISESQKYLPKVVRQRITQSYTCSEPLQSTSTSLEKNNTMNEKYILQAYELYRQDVANSATTPLTYSEFKAKLEDSCSCNKKLSWLPYFLGGAALVFILKK